MANLVARTRLQVDRSVWRGRPLARLALLAGLATPACVGSIGGDGAQPPASQPSKPGGGGNSSPSTPGSNGPNGPNNGSNEPNAPGSMTPGTPGAPSNPGTPGGPPTNPATCAPGPTRIWALTPSQYIRTVQSLLPTAAGAGDTLAAAIVAGTGFSNDAARLGMTEPYVAELLDGAWRLGSKASETPGQLAPCLAAAAPDEACLRTFVTSFGARAFRRDLSAAEADAVTSYLKQQATGGDVKAAIRRTVLYFVSSPHFLYRTELGPEGATGKVALTGAERAQALSYFLTDGPPDVELAEAARGDGLQSPAGIEAHTKRLLSKPASASGFVKLFREVFETGHVKEADKDAAVFPAWKAAFATDLAQESDAFIDQVLWGEDARFSTLLTAGFTMANSAVASFYGLPGGGTTFGKIMFPAGQRAGILTLAGRMASLAKNNDSDPVARGRFVREVMLCSPIPPPPATVNATPIPPDGKRTQRERLAQHSSDSTCSGCHSLMDPIGLAFENYDGIGLYRRMEAGKTIDTTGELTGAGPQAQRFDDAVGLLGLLAESPAAQRCFVSTVFRYAHGREPGPADACVVDRLATRFAASKGDMRDLAVAITTDAAFFTRQR